MLELTKRAVLMAEGVGGSGVVAMEDRGGGERGEVHGVDVADGGGGDVEVVMMEGGGWGDGLVVDGTNAGAGADDACTETESRTIHLAANQRTVRC